MEKPILTFALAACFASFVLFAAGCGGDDESSSQTTTEAPPGAPTDEWADSFCSALTTWKNDLEEAAAPLTDLSSLSEESLQQAADEPRADEALRAGDERGGRAPAHVFTSDCQGASPLAHSTAPVLWSAYSRPTAMRGRLVGPVPGRLGLVWVVMVGSFTLRTSIVRAVRTAHQGGRSVRTGTKVPYRAD